MVKCAKTLKATNEVTMKNINSHAQVSLGVCTRSKSLALKKLMSSSSIVNTDVFAASNEDSDMCYLQLRNRRLERRALPVLTKAKKLKGKRIEIKEKVEKDVDDGEGDSSFGENGLDYEEKERDNGRTTRDSTPTSFIVVSDICNKVPKKRMGPIMNDEIINITQNPLMISDDNLEEFFANVEAQSIEQFIKKYNFDPVNEKPLPGRYEWEKIKP